MLIWLKKFLAIVAVASTCLGSAIAQPTTDAGRQELLEALWVMSDAAVVKKFTDTPELNRHVNVKAILNQKGSTKTRAQDLRELANTWVWANDVELRAADGELGKQAKRLRTYEDRDAQFSSNWLTKALEALRFNARPDLPDFKGPSIPNWFPKIDLMPVVWSLLGIAVVTFAVFAAKHFSRLRNLRRVAAAVLDEDEPMRTLDEWLALADQYAAAGEHRLAVRCLFLAMLLRFDEAGIARFIRSETNWEHFVRIDRSPQRLEHFDFRTLCRRFDLIWYGKQTKGAPDVADFRAAYENLLLQLSEARA